ncbi:hypothetical protein PENSUB_5865 [Penicillium subrubescens]|uniref:Uncharacterized protein n=1 Tax=Penicillium subrubescens TaxID=1316194 RepID=A0A1Q5UQQ7_9EURO|nr:hypothetical protein PENSUB_5865 [Penicillium subrubescens]
MGPDWSEESLQSHIEIAHPHLTSSEGVVQLLWRSFHFYAYHPFSQNSIGGRIDWKAFQRAVAMLAAQGADLLGVKEEIESYWRFDGENLYDQAKLKRIFRSIGTPEKSTELSDESRHILEEATDVLAMTQPFFMHNGPHEHQLTPTAQRLLGEDLIGTRRRVTQKDLKMLLNILIRLSLFKENWGLSFPFGGFGPTEPGADGLANILASELKGGQRQEYLGFNRVNQIKHLLEGLVHIIDNANELILSSSVTGPQESVDKDTTFFAGQSAERNRIIIDPVNKLATLMAFSRDSEDLEPLKQNDSSSHALIQRENVEVLFSDVTILRVSGSVPTAVPGLIKANWTGDPLVGIPENAELRIQGEELRSRIMGFGSG